MFCPMMSAQDWSNPTAPAKYADNVTAMAAVDDCITAVIASPTAIKASTENNIDHQLTPGQKQRADWPGAIVRPVRPCPAAVSSIRRVRAQTLQALHPPQPHVRAPTG